MPLKLMYITNEPAVAQIAETAGVDRIFVDMEYLGKAERQGGMDTVKNRHTLEDVRKISKAIETAELLVRVNPIHEASKGCMSSREEIEKAIAYGADIIMLPYFKTRKEVAECIAYVDGKAKVIPLLETPEAAEALDDLLTLPGIDEMFIGLNDLSLGYGKKFMFELLSDGTVEDLCYRFKKAGIPYGFGGIAALGRGALPAEKIIKEHYRLGSTCAILSRSFCNTEKIGHMGVISETFVNGIREIRQFEKEVLVHSSYFSSNEAEIREIVKKIV